MLNVYAPGLTKKMFNLSNFINSNLSMVIAPAGYGKTHTIVQCVNQYDGCKKILILTHTHAGIAAIKDKLKRKNIPVSKYDVSTICSYTIMLMQDYHINKEDVPCIENTKEFYPFALNTARRCLRSKPVQAIIQARYDHLIVDEYQDCSTDHHLFIKDLSRLLKTHILGDYMQSIFTFNGPVVDLNSPEMMVGFWENQQQLDTP